MSAQPMPSGYDAWRTSMPDEIYCPDCLRAVDAPGRRKQDHDINCIQHPNFNSRYTRAAASAVRQAIKDALSDADIPYDTMRLYSVSDLDQTMIQTTTEVIGKIVTVRIFVSDAAIKEAL